MTQRSRNNLLMTLGRIRKQLSNFGCALRDYGCDKQEARLVFDIIERLNELERFIGAKKDEAA